MNNAIRKSALLPLALGLFLALAVPVSTNGISYQSAVAAEQATEMERIQLILKKLRSTMASMKDFDELEAAGMPKSQVNRMRKAMEQKVQQLTDDAVESIRGL